MYQEILVALDGSEYSLAGGEIALSLAKSLGSSILAVHIYDGNIHSHRLREMEPVLPAQYQEEETLQHVRDSHNELIYEGFKALSRGYIEEFQKRAQARGVTTEEVHREGRGYRGLLDVAEEREAGLIVMGAYGLGLTGDKILGSTALRVLRLARCDLLIARQEPSRGDILVGLDGSEEALEALRTAKAWARALERPLSLAAAYDPFFHGRVFNAMAGALTPERQADVGLNKQKSLHDNIIDKGLGMLYQRFLDRAAKDVNEAGMKAGTNLLKGKAFRALVDLADSKGSDLIVVGRHGHHHDDFVRIGSNSEAIVRLARTNVLVTGSCSEAGTGHCDD